MIVTTNLSAVLHNSTDQHSFKCHVLVSFLRTRDAYDYDAAFLIPPLTNLYHTGCERIGRRRLCGRRI